MQVIHTSEIKWLGTIMTTTMASTDNLCDEVRTMLMQRHATYGDSKDVFKKTAELWSCHLSARFNFCCHMGYMTVELRETTISSLLS